MNATGLYAKHLAKKKAQEKILEDLKDNVLRELKRTPEGKAMVDGVEFHLTTKATRRYPKDIKEVIDNLQIQIDLQKQNAEDAGKVTITETSTFDASIPKAAEKEVLGNVPDYRKYFGIK
jgi:hypothetical protein